MKREPVTPPKSKLGEALRYARNKGQALRRCTEDGRLPIDTGSYERALRQVALGRKTGSSPAASRAPAGPPPSTP